jgi:hypothetical protein
LGQKTILCHLFRRFRAGDAGSMWMGAHFGAMAAHATRRHAQEHCEFISLQVCLSCRFLPPFSPVYCQIYEFIYCVGEHEYMSLPV